MGVTTGDTVELLSRVPVFEDLSREELERIAQVTVPRSLDPGGVLFREGDESNTCYVVRAGHARLLRENADHRTITLAHFGPGDFFGELAMFGNEHRSGTVDAIDELELIGILGNDMRRLLREHADLALKL
ncbi:MAG: cyclic nucleotide-binding domain-containing protein, partial [Solirubrobacteraceae bacterium]